MKRAFVLVIFLALTLPFLGAKGQDEAEAAVSAGLEEKVLTIGLKNEPDSLHPLLLTTLEGETLAANIFDTLVSFKEDTASPKPLLADSWEISSDGKLYTFHLRRGVFFHNGDELKASDVKYTFEETLNPDNASPNAQFFAPVDKVETRGDYTVTISMKEPYAPFLLALGNPTSGILPEKVVREVGHQAFNRRPIGSGPYKFVEWLPDDRITLEKHTDYFLGEPNLDLAVFRPIPKLEVMAAELKAGGIDIASDLLPQDLDAMQNAPGFRVHSIPGLAYRYIGFSNKVSPFNDVRFRKAVYHAVPIDQAVAGIFKNTGQRAYNWIPPGVLAHDTEYMKTRALPHDPEKAKQLFDELKAEGLLKEGQEANIWVYADNLRIQMATVVATELKKYGINLKVASFESGTIIEQLRSEEGGDIYLMAWGSVPEPDRWTYRIFHSTSNVNFSKYDSPEVDATLEKGRSLIDSGQRKELYQGLMRRLLGEEYVHIPLIFSKISVVTSDRVEGFIPSPQTYIHLMAHDRNLDIK